MPVPATTGQLRTRIQDTCYLIQDDEGVKVFEGEWRLIEEDLSEELFQSRGMTSIPYQSLLELNSPKLLIWTPDEHERVKAFASPFDKLVLANDDINLDIIHEIHGLQVEGKNMRIIVSNDGGKTWNSYQDEEWIDVNIDNLDDVQEKGMSESEISLLGAAEWALILNRKRLRFGYMITIDTEVDMIRFNFDTHAHVRPLKKKRDYEARYTNNKLIVDLFESGDIKIHY